MSTQYLLWLEDKPAGPYTYDEIIFMLKERKIANNVLCTSDSGNTWTPIDEVFILKPSPSTVTDPGMTPPPKLLGSSAVSKIKPVASSYTTLKIVPRDIALFAFGMIAGMLSIIFLYWLFIFTTNSLTSGDQYLTVLGANTKLLSPNIALPTLRLLAFRSYGPIQNPFFDKPFIFKGRIKLAPDKPFSDLVQKVYNSADYTHLAIDSGSQNSNGQESSLRCSVEKRFGQPLLKVLTQDENRDYSGYFLVYIPSTFRGDLYYKRTGSFGSIRIIHGELIAFAPDEQSLRRILVSR